jgi:hypothetical protein
MVRILVTEKKNKDTDTATMGKRKAPNLENAARGGTVKHVKLETRFKLICGLLHPIILLNDIHLAVCV